MHDFAFVFAGFAVGLIVGLTGVGGGSLMTPILIFFFGIKPHMAIGTDLLFAAFTKMGGTVSLARQRLVPWRVVAMLCAGSIPAAFASLWLLNYLGPASSQAQHIMTTTLGVALLLTAAATLYKVFAFSHAKQATDHAKRLANPALATKPRHWSLPVLLGAVIGTLVTFTSVGAGAVGCFSAPSGPRLPVRTWPATISTLFGCGGDGRTRTACGRRCMSCRGSTACSPRRRTSPSAWPVGIAVNSSRRSASS